MKRSTARAVLAGPIAAAAMAGTLVGVGPAASAQPEPLADGADVVVLAAGCGTHGNPSKSGAVADWRVHCKSSPTRIKVTGQVKDTKADGKCAQVKAKFRNSTYYSKRACPKGTKVKFDSGWRGGKSVTVKLYTFRVE